MARLSRRPRALGRGRENARSLRPPPGSSPASAGVGQFGHCGYDDFVQLLLVHRVLAGAAMAGPVSYRLGFLRERGSPGLTPRGFDVLQRDAGARRGLVGDPGVGRSAEGVRGNRRGVCRSPLRRSRDQPFLARADLRRAGCSVSARAGADDSESQSSALQAIAGGSPGERTRDLARLVPGCALAPAALCPSGRAARSGKADHAGPRGDDHPVPRSRCLRSRRPARCPSDGLWTGAAVRLLRNHSRAAPDAGCRVRLSDPQERCADGLLPEQRALPIGTGGLQHF